MAAVSEEICAHCHRPYQVERENLGPWTIIDGVVYFKGRSLNVQKNQGAILRVLIRRGQAAHETLMMVGIGEESTPKTLAVQITKLRKRLPEGVTIENIFGFGYRLVMP